MELPGLWDDKFTCFSTECRRTPGQLAGADMSPGMNHTYAMDAGITVAILSFHDYNGEIVKALDVGHAVVRNGVTWGVGPPLATLFKSSVVVPCGLIMATNSLVFFKLRGFFFFSSF